MKKKMKWILLGIVVVVIVGVMVWPKDQSVAYNSEKVVRGNLSTYYSFSGNVVANNRKDYYAIKDVVIEEFYVENGAYVEQGDLLYKVQADSIQDSLTQAKSSLTLAKNNYQNSVKSVENQTTSLENALSMAERSFQLAEKNYNNYLQLYAIGGCSKMELDAQETSYLQAQINLNTARTNYDTYVSVTGPNTLSSAKASLDSAQAAYNTSIDTIGEQKVYAEISGEITFRTNETGVKLAQGSTIVTITDFDSLVAKIKVDEYDVSAIEIGKEAEVYVSSLGESLSGAVSNLSKNASTLGGIAFFNAEIAFPKNEHVLEGMSVEVKMLNSAVENSLLLPIKAIQFNEYNEPYVLVKEGNKLENKTITIGISDGIMAEITSGLEEGESVYYQSLLYPMMMGGMQ